MKPLDLILPVPAAQLLTALGLSCAALFSPAVAQDAAGTPAAGTTGATAEQVQEAVEVAKQKISEAQAREASAQQDDHAGHDHGTETAQGTAQTPASKPRTVLTTGSRPKTLEIGGGLGGIRVSPKAGPTPVQGPVATPVGASATAEIGPAGTVIVPEGGDEMDFGELLDGERRSHTFKFAAGGENDLVVQSVNKSCGCTSAELFVLDAGGVRKPYELGTPVTPGTEFELAAEVNTSGKRDRFESTVTVTTNETTPYRPFRLKAFVQPFFVYEPSQYLNLGAMFTSETRTEIMTVRGGQDQAFKLNLESVTPLPEYLNIELRAIEANADGRANTWEVVATLGPDSVEAASQNWPIRLVTDIPMPDGQVDASGIAMFHSTQVYVMAQVKGLVMAVPQYLSFGIVPPSETVERTAKIEIYDENFVPGPMTVEIKGLNEKQTELLSEKASARVEVLEDGSHQLTVSLTDMPDDMTPYGGPVVQGSVDVFVNHPKKERVRLILSGVVRDRVSRPAPAPRAHGGQ